MKKSRKTDQNLVQLIALLKQRAHENNAPIWRDIARRLDRPLKSWAEVNLRRLARYAKKNDTVIVPGKVLGAGNLDAPITVAAYAFSDSAKTKIRNAGGESISIPELVEKNPKGKGIRIIG